VLGANARTVGALFDRILEPCYPQLTAVTQRALCRAATDVTDDTARRTCVVFAPHADDETLGAGATIMRKVDAGTMVRLVVVTDGCMSPPGDPRRVAELRASELRAACDVLGLRDVDVTQLSFPDAELQADDEALADAVGEQVRRWQPDEVLVTSDNDPHDDHAALGAAVRRAMAGTANRVVVYPIWQYDRPWLLRRLARRSTRTEVVRADGYLEGKQRAIAKYRSQLAERNDDPEGLHPNFVRHFLRPYELFFPVRN
jgi:LmbE family N-acetylglucosaminyl deacetylase